MQHKKEKLEELIRNRKNDLDRVHAGDELWKNIEADLLTEDRPRYARLFIPVGVAASILIIITMLWMNYGNESPQNNENQSFVSFSTDDIVLKNPEGKLIPLAGLDSDLILVNFWASWHEKCMENNCYVFLPIYEKYKDMGFEIYGISIDSEKEAWLQSIEEEELPWINVSDLKSWQSPVARKYNVTRIPTSFLVDKNGKILARDLDAKELDQKLNDLLAYQN